MSVNKERLVGRAKNALMSFFETRLAVPKIYLNAEWGGSLIDVLAINRDGVGEVSAAIVYPRPYDAQGHLDFEQEDEMIDALLDRFASIPAQYKYIVAVNDLSANVTFMFRLVPGLAEKAFSPDGLGRVGFLTIDSTQGGDVETKTVIKPERFRAAIARLADEYIQQHEADWEIRA